MSEDKRSHTHTTGEVYVHPRGDNYRDNFDDIFQKNYGKCCDTKEECEGCKCSENLNGEGS